MKANDGDGQKGQMQEEMDTMTTTAEQQAPVLPPANINQHKMRWLIFKGGGHKDNGYPQ
jgi:hypothetical protein